MLQGPVPAVTVCLEVGEEQLLKESEGENRHSLQAGEDTDHC